MSRASIRRGHPPLAYGATLKKHILPITVVVTMFLVCGFAVIASS
ncbi:hypothetical protein [Allokutzneria multivorans]